MRQGTRLSEVGGAERWVLRVLIALACTLAPAFHLLEARAEGSKRVFRADIELRRAAAADDRLIALRVWDLSGLEAIPVTAPRLLLKVGASGEMKSEAKGRVLSVKVTVDDRGESAVAVLRVSEGGELIWTHEQVVRLSSD